MAATDREGVQDIQFRLMELASFDNFDGVQAVADLKANSGLWRAALMDGPVKLGELHDDGWNVDTLYVTATAGQEDGLEQLSNRWNADQVDWIGGEEACRLLGVSSPERRANPRQILRVWWD